MAKQTIESMPASLASTKVEFGKHYGKAFEEVRMHDPSYCSWVLLQDSQTCGDGLRRFNIYLKTASSGNVVADIEEGAAIWRDSSASAHAGYY